MQPTWMPHDEESSREVHGVAECHEEVAGGDVEGGEVDEGTCMTKDDERREVVSMGASAPTPSKPSMPPKG